jgi:hypothetical protein
LTHVQAGGRTCEAADICNGGESPQVAKIHNGYNNIFASIMKK